MRDVNKDKLILKVYKQEPKERRGNVVRIPGKSMKILLQYQRATGLPLKEIAGRLIEFASEYVEIVEVEG